MQRCSQRLTSLHVGAQDEMVIIEHAELFRKLDSIEIDENAAVKRENMRSVSLYGCGGIEDLASTRVAGLTSVKGSKPPKLPKLDRLFASRACRSSVMIGMALDRRRMTSIVRNLESLDQPWNCPHGRPTMRHLYDMRCLKSSGKTTTNRKKKRRRVFSYLDDSDDE